MIWGFLIASFSVLFCVLAWRRTDWAIALTIFELPSYLVRFNLFGIPMTLLEVMILLLFLVCFTRNHAKLNAKLRFNGYQWPMLLVLIAATISIYFSENKVEALGIWKAYFVEPMLFFVVITNYKSAANIEISGKRFSEMIIGALGCSAIVVSIYAIVQKFTGFGIPNPFWAAEATRRVTSFFEYPNAVGLYLAPIAILFFGIGFTILINQNRTINRRKIIFCIFVFILSCAAIFFAQSEGALIGLAGGIVLFLLLCPNKKVRIFSFVLLVLLVSLVLLVPATREYVSQKFTLSDLSGQIRQQQWKETWNMLKDGRLISGAGLANYQIAIKPYHQSGIWIQTGESDWLERIHSDEAFRVAHWQPTEIYLYPHNFILNFWSETGLLGVIAMFWLIILFIRNYWRTEKENRKYYLILICVLATILIHGMVDVPYFKNDLSVMWWVLFGGSLMIANRHESLE